MGFKDVVSKRIADSAWVHAGPTALPSMRAATYETRVVAYWDGSSTHFRQFVSVTPNLTDSVSVGQLTIPFCGASGSAAAVQAIVPQNPTGEESLKLWTRMP